MNTENMLFTYANVLSNFLTYLYIVAYNDVWDNFQ